MVYMWTYDFNTREYKQIQLWFNVDCTADNKKKWYDIILSGEKTEEYREIKPYYDSRFESVFGCQWLFRGIDGVGDTTPPEKEIIFRNGYSRSSRQAKATCTLTKGTGNPEWGAEPGVKYYVLHIKKIQEA